MEWLNQAVPNPIWAGSLESYFRNPDHLIKVGAVVLIVGLWFLIRK